MKLLTTIAPLPEAVKKLEGKTIVASRLRTKGWSTVPVALTDRAFFSAGIENARYLETAQSKILDAIRVKREELTNGKTAFVDRSSFIGDMRKLAGVEKLGTGTGTITDPASRARLGLIYDIQLQSAQGAARFKWDMDPDILDAFPAQELVREQSRRQPRDWNQRWRDAASNVDELALEVFETTNGRMVALKTSAIWTEISAFGVPWPPYDYNSGMGVEDRSRAEAEQLGLLEPEEEVEPIEEDFNADLAASAENIHPSFIAALKRVFGSKLVEDGNTLRWAA